MIWRPKKPVVALLGDLPLFGDRTQNLPPATVIDTIRGFFEVRAVMGTVARFDDDVDVVMIAQAARVDIATLYALDQFRARRPPGGLRRSLGRSHAR